METETPKIPIRVFGYARKSPDAKESTDLSIFNQTKLIEEYCNKSGWELIEIFIDKNISGSDRDRRAFESMFARAISGEVNMIVVKDQDRFARDSSFFRDRLIDLDARKIRVFSITKNGFLSADDLADMVMSIVDDNYIRKCRAKTKLSYESKMNDGLPAFVPPFGYRFSKGNIKNWVISKEESNKVNLIVSDYILGISLKDTMKTLKINKSLYYRVINNAIRGIYNGLIVYFAKRKDSKGTVISKDRVEYTGTYESILPEHIYKQLIEVHSNRNAQ
jgi:DNA invertase Pin-like site-specific DNA recombinase